MSGGEGPLALGEYPPGYFPVKRICIECGTDFEAMRPDRQFCKDRCQRDHFNRMYRRAREVYAILYEMQTSYKKRGLLGIVTRMVREHVLEDQRAGRRPPQFKEF